MGERLLKNYRRKIRKGVGNNFSTKLEDSYGIEKYIETVIYDIFFETHRVVINDNNIMNIIREVYGSRIVMKNLVKLFQGDLVTYKHSINTAILAIVIGAKIGLNKDKIRELAVAGILHDLGKLDVPIDVLNKCGRLNEYEMRQIKEHCNLGYSRIKKYKSISEEVKLAVLMHHERIDGSGYPNGVSGNEINLYAKILAIADVYDALVSDRPYHKPFTQEKAISILLESADKFDKELLSSFLECIDEDSLVS